MRSFIEYIGEATSIPFSVQSVEKDVHGVFSQYIDKEPTFQQLVNSLAKLSKKYLFAISFVKSADLGSGDMTVVGYYDPEVDRDFLKTNEYPIELFLVFSTKDKRIAVTKQGLLDISRAVAETLAHEWHHKVQATARKWLIRNEPKAKYTYKVQNVELGSYLAADDEIEAYAFNIAGSILDHFSNDKKSSFDFLKRPKTGVIPDAHLDEYLNTFGVNHVVTKRLIKKIVYFIDKRAEQHGKDKR